MRSKSTLKNKISKGISEKVPSTLEVLTKARDCITCIINYTVIT